MPAHISAKTRPCVGGYFGVRYLLLFISLLSYYTNSKQWKYKSVHKYIECYKLIIVTRIYLKQRLPYIIIKPIRPTVSSGGTYE